MATPILHIIFKLINLFSSYFELLGVVFKQNVLNNLIVHIFLHSKHKFTIKVINY